MGPDAPKTEFESFVILSMCETLLFWFSILTDFCTQKFISNDRVFNKAALSGMMVLVQSLNFGQRMNLSLSSLHMLLPLFGLTVGKLFFLSTLQATWIEQISFENDFKSGGISKWQKQTRSICDIWPENKRKGIPHYNTVAPHSGIQNKILGNKITILPNTRIPEDNAFRAEQKWK